MCRKNRIILLRMSLCLFLFSHSCTANLNPVVLMAGIRSCFRQGVGDACRCRIGKVFSAVLGMCVDSMYGTSIVSLGPKFIQILSVDFSCHSARGDTRCTLSIVAVEINMSSRT